MATYDLEEQEQLDELKTWWKMHGTLITAVIAAAAIGMLAWQGWQWWQRSKAVQASQVYAAMQQALAQQDSKRVRVLAGELIDKFSSTSYAGMAAMLSGKLSLESGDLKSAQAQFGWAAEHAKDDGLRDLARLRQAIALADEKNDKAYDEALKLLAVPPVPSIMPRYLEVRGDILAAQGKFAEARTAYDEALKAVAAAVAGAQTNADPGGQYRDILKAKRDAAGGKA